MLSRQILIEDLWFGSKIMGWVFRADAVPLFIFLRHQEFLSQPVTIYFAFVCFLGRDIRYNASALSATLHGKEEHSVSSYCRTQGKVSTSSPRPVHATGRVFNQLCHEECFTRENILQRFGLFWVK